MDIDLSVFHFLRPAWLLLAAAGIALGWRLRAVRRAAAGSHVVSAQVLPYLLARSRGSAGPAPIHAVVALLVLGGIAAAGPTWRQERPAFVNDRAPMIVALDISPSMDAPDVPPSRLEAAKHKIRDLVGRRAGARTGLVVYAGSAHLVLPPTDDADLLDLYVSALSTDLIGAPGKDAAGAIAQAVSLLRAPQGSPAVAGDTGTVLLVTDGADASRLPDVDRLARGSDAQVLVLAVGLRDTGVLRDAQGRTRLGPDGKPVLGGFDPLGLQALAKAAGAPLGSLSMDGSDLDWIEMHAQRHYEAALRNDGRLRWKDAGYWLCMPLALIALLSVRRGWSVGWNTLLLGAALWAGLPQATQAGPLADAFFTADQQGYRAWERGDYARAASLFHDPYWKGRAAYEARDYTQALAAFATLDTPEGYFYVGNTQARLFKYEAALAAYDRALGMRPDFPQARFNRDLVAGILAKLDEDRETEETETRPDEQQFDAAGAKGKTVQVQVAAPGSADLWLKALNVSPARYLRTRFGIEDARRAAAPGGARP